MQKMVDEIVYSRYGIHAHRITKLGGGFYGRVFLAELDAVPHRIVIKIYLFPNLAQREADQLRTLSGHGISHMPKVYFVQDADEMVPHGAIAMEYIPGINAGSAGLVLKEKDRLHIANEIVDNLISYHQTLHPEGFGELEASHFAPDWQSCYRPKALTILGKAEHAFDEGNLDCEVLCTMTRACKAFSEIFHLPIPHARLIHGDYNTWNVLLNDDLSTVKAVIDPFNCCWADSEMDLYQLRNANGDDYQLMDLYQSKLKLSDNCQIKTCFYELFTELMHYRDANIDISKSGIPAQAKRLAAAMDCYGIGG